MLERMDSLMPLVLEALADQSSALKRQTALRTIGSLAQSAGYVIDPYSRHPSLMPLLLSCLKPDESAATRREAVRLLGVLGAYDPYRREVTHISRDLPAFIKRN